MLHNLLIPSHHDICFTATHRKTEKLRNDLPLIAICFITVAHLKEAVSKRTFSCFSAPYDTSKINQCTFNSSIDEIYEKKSRIHLGRLQNKFTHCKGIRNNTVLDKLLEYKRNWIQHVNRMPRDRLPRIMKHYSPTGRMNRGRPFKRLLVT